ncbi:MAG: threonine aldolase family protein [Acidobacteriota bacterium]
MRQTVSGAPPVDLRSDTVTRPSPAMRRAIAAAEVGDDVLGEDPTVVRLEERGAAVLNMEAGLFCASGTMGNEIAIAAWTQPGQEVILEARSHPLDYELGGMGMLSGVLPRPVASDRGRMDPSDVESAIRKQPYYVSRTGLIIVENTHNMWGGTILDAQASHRLAAVARRHDLPIHLDGARLFNAAAALGAKPADLCQGFDSVMISFSKGLGAPAGSLLAGSRSFIHAARRVRKRFGGGWRQAGILAAAALVALEESPPLLPADHRRARQLAETAAGAGFAIDPSTVETNIVVFGTAPSPAGEVVTALAAAGVLCMAVSPLEIRLVTHIDVDDRAAERACQAIQSAGRR